MGSKYITDSNNTKWFRVEEELPEGLLQYEYVLTYSFSLGEYNIMYYLRDENEWWSNYGNQYEFHTVSHWRPLPIEPSESDYKIYLERAYKENLCRCERLCKSE